MTKTILKGLVLAAALTPAIGLAQTPKSATYITDNYQGRISWSSTTSSPTAWWRWPPGR